MAGFSFLSTVKPHIDIGSGNSGSAAPESRFRQAEWPKYPPKSKDPSGGTTGRVSSHMGAWGGWALAPNTASMGRDNRSHRYCVAGGSPEFKRPCDFFNFLARDFWTENYCAAGGWPSPTADLSDATAA